MESSSPFFDAFISYGRADSKSFATKLFERLEAIGLDVWFDQEDIPLAVDFQEQINNGIEKTHNFIFVIAPHSVNSPYCLKEIELAIKLNKRIIPILHVEEITRELWQSRNPDGSDTDWANYQEQGKHTSYVHIHPVISKINWIFFREALDDFEVSLEGLISAIKKHEDYIHKHTEYLNKALEWSRNQKRNQYLLKEEEKRQAGTWLKYKFVDEQSPCLPTSLHSEFICESIKQAQGLMTQACLCYVRQPFREQKELSITEKIRDDLLANCIVTADNCANFQTAQDFDAATRRNIELADNFIYFVSPKSLQNDYCQLQFQYAFQYNKRLIFLLIKDTPSELYPGTLDEINVIDFSDVETAENYRLSLDALLNLLGEDEYYHECHKRLFVKALKWQEQRRIDSMLLRGHQLDVFEDLLKISNQRKFQQFIHLQKEFLGASAEQVSQAEIEIFIAYDLTNIDFATKLNESLEYQGKITYFAHDHADLSGDFQGDVHQGIVSGANFLLVISPAAIASSTCVSYLEHAKSLSKRRLGVMCQPTELSQVEAVFTDEQWVDFSRINSDFYADFSQLIRLLDTDKAYVQSHTKWLQRALEWEQKYKTRDLLLRGNELAIAQYWLKEAEEENKRPIPTDLQRKFIQSSITESLKNKRRQKFLFGAVSVGFVISTVLGIIASRKSYEAAVNELNAVTSTSEALFYSGNILEAFVESISAWTKEKKINLNRDDLYIQQEIRRVISQSVYQLKESNRLIDHEAAVNAIDYSTDGQLLVSGSADKSIILWDENGNYLETLGEIGPIRKGHTASVNTVAFSPSDEYIVSGSADSSIKIWKRDADGGYQFRRTIYGCTSNNSWCHGHSDSINSVAFRYDGLIASAGADRTIKLWNLEGEYQGSVGDAASQHQEAINSIIFSPDGGLIISASADGSN
ncbi:MAG: TIR domain-containing protein [Limnothrix sp. RL_2_0]|nr:TIR domain-containing protein [Limnothrix sp. RL_2_0]